MTNRSVWPRAAVVVAMVLGGGAMSISCGRAQETPDDTSLGEDHGHVDEHGQADPHEHGHEEAAHGEDAHETHGAEDAHETHGAEDAHEAHGAVDAHDPDEHEDDKGHDPHAGHGAHAEESIVQLSVKEREKFGVKVATARSGSLTTRLNLPGEIVLNADRVAHIVPRSPGIVREVCKTVGDTVRSGEVMAWLESAELGEAKVDYLAKWAELSCCALDLARAQEVRDNTVRFLEVLTSTPSLETLRDMNGGAMGKNRGALVSAHAEFVYAKAAYEREKPLFEKKVASEQNLQAAEAEYKKAEAIYAATRDNIDFNTRRDLLEAKRSRQVREIEVKGARRRLYVLGLTTEEIAELEAHVQPQATATTQPAQCNDPNCKDCKHAPANVSGETVTDPDEAEEKLAWYPLRAPFDGRVIEKHLTLGEKHGDDFGAFTIADLSSVWVDIAVYQKDLAYVKQGMSVSISAGVGLPRADGTITYVSPVVDKDTRTAMARVILPNPSGEWRPGLFISAELAVGEKSTGVIVPRSSVQRMGEEPVVFLDTTEGFKSVPVLLGRSDASHVEILSGLAAGQRYVAQAAFELKAKIVTSGLDPHAGHGH